MPKPPKRKASKPKARRNPDPAWLPLVEAIRLQEKQTTGSTALTIKDLERDLVSGHLRSMRRDVDTGTSEPLPAAFWSEHLIDVSTGVPLVYRCDEGDRDDPGRWSFYSHHGDRLDAGVYFVSADRRERQERRGRGPLFSAAQITALQIEYRKYKKANPKFKRENAIQHLQDHGKRHFDKLANRDTVRDRVMKPVDFVEK